MRKSSSNTIIKEIVLIYVVLLRKRKEKKIYPNKKVIENGSQSKNNPSQGTSVGREEGRYVGGVVLPL